MLIRTTRGGVRRFKVSASAEEELADRAGLHRTYVSGVERGVRNPTLTVMEKFAKALEADLAAIVADV